MSRPSTLAALGVALVLALGGCNDDAGVTGLLPTGKVESVTLGKKDPCCAQRAEVCVTAESDQKSGERGPGAKTWKKGRKYCQGNYDPAYLKNCKAGKLWPGCYGKGD